MLAGVDGEHLLSAREGGLGEPGHLASFGTNWWSEAPSERLDALPTGVPIYFYVVTRGLDESVPVAQWRGTFVAYHEGPLSEADWQSTRPRSARDRRDPNLPDDEREPDWAGYVLVADLLEIDRPVPLNRFWVKGRHFAGSVVRHPQLADLRE